MYSAFDEILTKYDLYKVEVIGDAYYVVSGCPVVKSPVLNAESCVLAALAMLRTIPRVCDDNSVQIRVGIHSGSVIAGVVGFKDPRYHVSPAILLLVIEYDYRITATDALFPLHT